jgi:hypothetical protein
MVSPPPDVGSQAGAAAAVPSRASPSGTQRGAAPPDGPPAVDRADIRPLDLPGALQILIAEVRAALIETLAADLQAAPDSPGAAGQPRNAPIPGDAAAAPANTSVANAETFAASAAQDLDGPVTAARVIVDLLLRSLPENFEPESGSVMLPRVDQALQAGIERAIDAVSAWRDVPPAVLEAARESASLALALSADEPTYPWPPPEWLGMAPRLALLWRRRRVLKRRLVDPDYAAGRQWDDLEEPKR